jgi:hypothetical protein
VCKYHRRGECAKGPACEWSHDLGAEPCRRALLVGVCERAARGACPFSHDFPRTGPAADALRAVHLAKERERVALGMRPGAGLAGVVCGDGGGGGGGAGPALGLPPPASPGKAGGAGAPPTPAEGDDCGGGATANESLRALAVQGGTAWAARPAEPGGLAVAAGDLLAGVLSSRGGDDGGGGGGGGGG